MDAFIQWLNSSRNQLCEDAQALFDDSIRCYKNDIFRAAYLLAYQGVMRHLKEVIIQTKMPPKGFTPEEWGDWKRKLKNQDRWDTDVMEAVKLRPKHDGSKDGILTVNDEVRDIFNCQWRVWRNECAHYKGNTFMQAHVLVFYAFIKDHLLSISVEGGMRSLLKEFDEYFDPAMTPKNEPVRPLLKKIKTMVKPNEYREFIIEIRRLTGGAYNKSFTDIIEEIYQCCEEDFKKDLTDYIKENPDLMNWYIDQHPDAVFKLLREKTEIRRFWYEQLKFLNFPLPVLAHLLEGEYINMDEKIEAYKKIQELMYKQNRGIYDLEADYRNVLLRHGYFDYFLNNFFTKDHMKINYNEKCYKTDFYISHLRMMPVNRELAQHIIDIFQALPYPYTLRDRFVNEFMNDEGFRKEFTRVCEENGMEIPDSIIPEG